MCLTVRKTALCGKRCAQSSKRLRQIKARRRPAPGADSFPTILFLRVAWLYGVHGQHFIKKIRDRALQMQGTGKPLKVVTDEVGTPTYTVDVCRQTLKLLTTDHRGTFHCTNEGFCSRYEFAREILRAYAIDVPLEPCTSKDFVLPAPRPAYSVLENQRLKQLGINIMRDWKVAFGEYVARIISPSLIPCPAPYFSSQTSLQPRLSYRTFPGQTCRQRGLISSGQPRCHAIVPREPRKGPGISSGPGTSTGCSTCLTGFACSIFFFNSSEGPTATFPLYTLTEAVESALLDI